MSTSGSVASGGKGNRLPSLMLWSGFALIAIALGWFVATTQPAPASAQDARFTLEPVGREAGALSMHMLRDARDHRTWLVLWTHGGGICAVEVAP